MKSQSEAIITNLTAIRWYDSNLIAVMNGGSLSIDNCSFINSTSSQMGLIENGLAVTAISSSVRLSNSTFRNLQSQTAPAIYAWDNPQSNRQQQQITVSNCLFYNNTAIESGGNILIEDVLFSINNSAIHYGGAIRGNGGAIKLHWSMNNPKSILNLYY